MTLDERIAIVGMHIKLPAGIDTCEDMWRLVVEGRTVFSHGPITGQYVAVSAQIADANLFAAGQFGISDSEAGSLDPQHRLLLELSWECLASAPSAKEAVTGVFSSCSQSLFLEEIIRTQPRRLTCDYRQILEGSQGDYLATGIAYRLGLTGPAVHISSGCSSSLAALALAVKSLNTFECDRALVAAASVRSGPNTGYDAGEGGFYSPDGYCRPFADDANGTVPGNGAVVVLLKRLEDAIADNDRVRAIILGCAVNNDGDRKVGFCAPSVDGQRECICAALDVAEVDPAEVCYVEAHGTGTRVGDPVELRALARAYGRSTPSYGRFVGSVKANIGHCDVAGGLFALVKTSMALENRVVPPQIYVTTPTTKHDWSDGSLRITDVPIDLGAVVDQDAPLTAAVCSLGVGGTNVHVLLRDAQSVLGVPEQNGQNASPVTRVTGRKPCGPATAPSPEVAETGADTSRVDGPIMDVDSLQKFSRSTVDAAIDAEIAERRGRIVPAAPRSSGDLILLTGASGFVGSFILAEMLSGGARVACLLRGGEKRRADLVRRMGELGLWKADYAHRLDIVAGDIADPHLLGIDSVDYGELAERVSTVVHCAAWVNHIYPYKLLARANASSAAAVLEFAVARCRKPVTFISTDSVFGSPAYPPGSEIAATALTAFPPDHAGYSRSKAIAEAYFERAAQLEASVAIVRLPNIFGDLRAFQLNPADTIWSWTRAIIMTGRYPSSYDLAGNELFQALPADVTARIVVRLARPHDTPGCRIINATPNLACSSRNYIAGLREAGHDITPLADGQWYELVSALDPGEIWIAGTIGRRTEHAGTGSARQLHRFLLDEEPVISKEVNTHAIWTPKDVAAYAASLAINPSPKR